MTKQLIKQLSNFQIKNNKAVLRADIYLKLIVDKWFKMAIYLFIYLFIYLSIYLFNFIYTREKTSGLKVNTKII